MDVPVPSEEEEVSLIMQRDDLPTLELGYRREERLHRIVQICICICLRLQSPEPRAFSRRP